MDIDNNKHNTASDSESSSSNSDPSCIRPGSASLSFETLYNGLPIAAQSLDKNGQILSVNDKWVEILGYSFDEVKGFPITDFMTQASADKFIESFKILLEEGHSGHLNIQFINKENHTLDILYEGCAKLDQNGQFIYTNCTLQDITKEKELERLAQFNEDRYKALSSATFEAIFISEKGICIDANDRAYKMFGYDEGELIGIFGTDVIAEEYKENVKQNMLSGYEKPYDVIAVRKDGSQFHAEIRGKMIEYNDKNVRVTAVRNINERKKAETSLQKSQNQLKLAQKTAKIGHWELDIQSNELYWSDEVYRIFGLEPQGSSSSLEAFIANIHPDDVDMVLKAYAESVNHKTEYNIIHRLKPKDGKTKYVNERCQTSYDENGEAMFSIGTVADVTELIEKENRIAKQNQELSALNTTKDKIFSIIAHDLKGPFTAILGFSQLLINASKNQEFENIERYSNLVNASAQDSFNLLNNLLQWARLQSKKIEIRKEQVNIHETINDVIDSIEGAANKKQIDIIIDINKTLSFTTDSFMLATIFRNLISNAIKFSNPKQTVKVYAQKEAKEMLLGVIDRGVGIDEANKSKILDSTLNFTTKGTKNEQGTGLGLSICIEFIKKQGGRLDIISEPKRGSHFKFYLPT